MTTIQKPKYRMLDLFSGLGGASSAMCYDDRWEVVKIDHSSMEFHYDYANIPGSWMPRPARFDLAGAVYPGLTHYARGDFDFVWASPPCYEFSLAHNFNGGRVENPDLGLMLNAKAIIDRIKPRWWAIENVQGACKHFMPYLGHHHARIGPYYLWGNVPVENVRIPDHYVKCNTGSQTRFRNHRNAVIPFEISRGIRDNIEAQRRLTEWA